MKRRTVELLLLGIILIVAFAVRAVNLDGQGFFIDEVSEVSLAKKPVAEIINTADSMPPLYPILLKGWVGVWGTDAAARWFSVVCGMGSIVCVWAIARRLGGEATGLASALVVALLPMHVYYSQFARCYSLMFLLASLSLWLLLRAIDGNLWRDWLLFAVVTILGAYTHYYFALVAAASVLVILLMRRRWWIGSRAAAAYALIGLGVLPLCSLLAADLDFQKGLRDPRPVNLATLGYTYFSMFSGYTLGPSPNELQTMTGSEAIRGAWPWPVIMAMVLLVLGYEGAKHLYDRRALAVVIALAIVPAALLAALSLIGDLNYNVRFVTWIMIAASVWLGAGIAGGWRKWQVQAALLVFAAMSLTAMYNRQSVARYQNEDMRGAAAFLAANASSSDTIYVVSDYLADALRYYMDDHWRIVELPVPGEVNHIVETSGEAEKAARALAASDPDEHRFWLVYSRTFHADPEGLLLKELSSRHSLTMASTLAGVFIFGQPEGDLNAHSRPTSHALSQSRPAPR